MSDNDGAMTNDSARKTQYKHCWFCPRNINKESNNLATTSLQLVNPNCQLTLFVFLCVCVCG